MEFAGTCAAAAPACDDGVRNGDEAGVDCGGSTCAKCAAGKCCSANDDCESGVCDTSIGAVCRIDIEELAWDARCEDITHLPAYYNGTGFVCSWLIYLLCSAG